jgi:hypothetical protein
MGQCETVSVEDRSLGGTWLPHRTFTVTIGSEGNVTMTEP